ncbi:hypothetical protein GQ464_017925 [Rhodocaloribacter litoris]|uniref:hypothetical protein n=1 Tax=Rhodocaloribacter litoris TaxID=2558931 RepID=UPI001421730A|nr:hypothetical protein [Rhodocaloribacter litoris]QXD15251.1 hypothetical protein GQ464_017925 [Rhodocaloribacter litoris]
MPYEPQNRGLVITVCIFTATLLWLIFTMQAVHTVSLSFPTEIRNLPPDEALVALPPRTVRVQVKGEGIQLLRLYYNPPTVPIDAGAGEINFDGVVTELAGGVQVEGVFPRTFVVRKEERTSRTVPIHARVEVRTPPAFELLGPVRLRPDSVAVSGAVSVLENLHFWPTVHRVFENVRDTLRTTVPLADTLAGLVLREFDAVEVLAVVEEFTEAVREIRVLVPGAPLGQEYVQLAPPTITVRYRVPLSQYDAAQRAEDFFATVSYDEIRADTTGRVRPRLHTPANLALRDVDYFPRTLRYFNVLLER